MNWERLLENAKKENYSHKAYCLEALSSAIQQRKETIRFSIDSSDTLLFLHDLAVDVINSGHLVNKLVKLPYPKIIIDLPEAKNTELQGHKLRSGKIFYILEEHTVDGHMAIKCIRWSAKNNDVTIPLTAFDLILVNPKEIMKDFVIDPMFLFTPELMLNKSIDEQKNSIMATEGHYFGANCKIIVGFCLALQTKSMLDVEDIPPITKNIVIGKSAKKIKESGYKKLSLSLKAKQHKEYLEQKDLPKSERSASRMHLRRGHFKQRKTGLFWWNPHLACKEANSYLRKDYEVKF